MSWCRRRRRGEVFPDERWRRRQENQEKSDGGRDPRSKKNNLRSSFETRARRLTPLSCLACLLLLATHETRDASNLFSSSNHLQSHSHSNRTASLLVPLTSLQFQSRHFLQRINIPHHHVLIKSSYQSKLCTIAVPSPGITQDSSRKPDPASQCRTSSRNTKNQQHSCFPSKSHGAYESCIIQYRSRGEKEGGLQK